LLYVGFNRRFATLVQQLTKHPKPTQIYWQKNRVNLPGDPRTFVFDDFIHVVDSLRFLANGSVKNLRVFPKIKNNLLSAIQVIWDQKGTTLHGSMNRLSGITEERLEYYTEENKWTIDDLSSGIHYTNDQQYPIANDTWNTTLYKRGFEGLFKDWLQALRSKTFDSVRNNDIWQTHNLCETIVSKIEAQQ
jgi:virulence factor